ncbi:hypothetical protein C4E15_06640 [Achromobacter spanius]|uniref:Uncharacterized protein n=1 Tax=Achromobacter spanius TaxID=217203 RepID=A0A2S5GTZ7_9BURK|nr:hypothetical protein [Achromobacter spanius]PPA76469.1 hypothetical protein C4E15_06640 [Achromobacter spanius]
MFSITLTLTPERYIVESSTEHESREFLFFRGAYERRSAVFETATGETIDEFEVKVGRIDAAGEVGIIRAYPRKGELLPISINGALTPTAFDRIADGVARNTRVVAIFSDNFFTEEKRPFTIVDGYPTRIILSEDTGFAFALHEARFFLEELGKPEQPSVVPAPAPAPIAPIDYREMLAAIRTRLTMVAALLLGLLIYAVR